MATDHPTPDELREGDVVIMKVPCRITILGVDEVDGTVFNGNRRIRYECPSPVDSSGEVFAGSRVTVERVDG